MEENEGLKKDKEELAKSLYGARLALLELPGIEEYVFDKKAKDEKIDMEIERMVSDVTLELDAKAMSRFLAFSLAWGNSESDEFFAHSERIPFRSKMEFSQDVREKREQVADILKYLHQRYKKLKAEGSSEAKGARGDFRAFYVAALDDLFSSQHYEFIDRACGFEPGSREEGEVRVGKEMLGVIWQAVREAGGDENLYDKVLAATAGGYYALLFPFLYNHRGEGNLRRVAEVVLEKRNSDPALVREKVQLLWQVERFRMSLGISLDDLFEMFELPPAVELEERIHLFLRDERLTDEVLNYHIANEAKGVYAQFKEDGRPMDFWKILAERAEAKNLPDETDSFQTIEERRIRIQEEISKYNPLGFIESERAKLFFPTKLGAGMGISAALRPVNVEYTNIDGDTVCIFETNPRDNDLRYAASLGHESGHKAHVNIVDAAEKEKLIPEHSWGRIPGSVKEVFSLLLEKQTARLFAKESTAKTGSPEGLEWTDLLDAYILRRQGVYGLVQIKAREMMQDLWDEGVREDSLTDAQIRTISDSLASRVSEASSEGVPISVSLGGVWGNINVLDAFDGTNYLRKYLYGEFKKMDLNTTFVERFGEDWIKNPDARALYYRLMIEAATNFDLATYRDFVQSADVEEVKSHPVIRKLGRLS